VAREKASMGGLNALLVSLSQPKLFQKVAALCPALFKDSPAKGWTTIRAFLERTGADPEIIFGLMSIARSYAVGEDEWKSLSPLELLETTSASEGPEYYLSCGLYDKYGNFEGSDLFARRAKEKGLKIEWRPLYGGHCASDVVSLANFLLK
jgi:S-formylglutathione hydrolase FrmB